MSQEINFTGIISSFDKNELFWETHIPIPNIIYEEMLPFAQDKRIICTLNNSYTFHCGMLPKKTFHYILLNKEICKKLCLQVNDTINVTIKNDDSKYGMNISEELEESLYSDPEGSNYFHLLTPGKQRNLIHIVNKFKSSQLRIEKSFVIIEHLKRHKGILDFKQLNQDFKNHTNRLHL